jgi:predicted ATPase
MQRMNTMFHLKTVKYIRKNIDSFDEYPFSVPLLKNLDEIVFDSPVTIIVGENGTGKSTLMESLACAVDSITVGNESVNSEEELEGVRRLSRHFKLAWTRRTNKGFFLRAEDFINYSKKLYNLKKEMDRDLREVDNTYSKNSQYAKNLAKLPYLRSLGEMNSRYEGELIEKSHGEGFLEFFKSRFVPGGLYILDEPETPLSPMNQYVFIGMIYEMIKQNSQFIIATHSPIIMAFPGAVIYDLNGGEMKRVDYEDLEAVKFTRAFLNDPGRFISYLDM